MSCSILSSTILKSLSIGDNKVLSNPLTFSMCAATCRFSSRIACNGFVIGVAGGAADVDDEVLDDGVLVDGVLDAQVQEVASEQAHVLLAFRLELTSFNSVFR
jgi:hypothetical protein